ncbi:MAG: DUF1800 domain-containing protein, partial [Saprospiraceae bacterium]|nr:DUF1800 domain-containing protein [Saprospiraceae bacterium]
VGKPWIDNSTLTLRLSLAGHLFNSAEVNLRTKGDPEDLEREKGMKKLQATVDMSSIFQLVKGVSDDQIPAVLADFLLVAQPAGFLERLDTYLQKSGSREERIRISTLALMSLPEYQMC